MQVHQPGVAGRFYPADSGELSRLTTRLIGEVRHHAPSPPKALILPHAGMAFAGPIAAEGIGQIAETVERVIVLGPSHRHNFDGIALPGGPLSTPLGVVPLDPAAALLPELAEIRTLPDVFDGEHSIEVLLPLLQSRIKDFVLLPMLVGNISPGRLAEILDALWGGAETLVVISTDLSHFLTAAEAVRRDSATAMRIERGEVDDGLTEDTPTPAPELSSAEACGYRPLAAFLQIADKRGLRMSRLALTHSGQVTGETERVVGYGAWMAHHPDAAILAPKLRSEALDTARKALVSRLHRGTPPVVDLTTFSPVMHSIGASFVTLTLNGQLRGCIGSLRSDRPLIQDIVRNAVQSGFADPRFRPMMLDEVRDAGIEIAILGRPTRLEFASLDELLTKLRPHRDGLILSAGEHRGTFLPKVWDVTPTPLGFLTALKRKAGLAEDHPIEEISISRFVTESFSTSSPPVPE